MRVLQIGKYYSPHRGGIERVLEVLCQEIRTRCDLQVLCFHTQPETITELVDHVLVTRMARWESIASAPIAPGMYFWLKDRRYDIVNLHGPNPVAEMMYLLTRPPGKLVYSYHAEPQKPEGLMRLYSPVARAILKRADAITAASPHHLAKETTLHEFREKTHVIPYGIDQSPFRTMEEEDPRVTHWKEKMGGPFVLFVGRLVNYKGLLPLIEAVR